MPFCLCVCMRVIEALCLIQFTFYFWESHASGCFVWACFARGYEKVVNKTLRRSTERLFVSLGFILMWFFFLELMHSCMEAFWEREQGTGGKRVEHVQKSRKGIKKETENVRGVRRACHDKAWMLRRCP